MLRRPARVRPHVARAALAVVLSACVVAAQDGPAQAAGQVRVKPHITGGAPDGSAHSYVAMVLPPGQAKPTCTAVLVRADNVRTVLLTDAHCLYRNGQLTGTGVGFTFAAVFGSTTPVTRGSFSIDPAYDPRTHLHDVAVIATSGSGPAPALLGPLGRASQAAGSDVDTVGTGQPYPGQRRHATEVVTSVSSAWMYLKPGSGNSCDGDSGGPDLVAASTTVLALTDQGTCSYDQDTRLDTASERVFIDRAAGLNGTRSTVQYGSTGTDVKVVQSLLGTTVDGGFGSGTRSAVQAWQRGHGLTSDGVVGPMTWSSLGW